MTDNTPAAAQKTESQELSVAEILYDVLRVRRFIERTAETGSYKMHDLVKAKEANERIRSYLNAKQD